MSEETVNELAVADRNKVIGFGSNIFRSAEYYTEAWKMACSISKSQFIPDAYKNRPEDCLIAIEMSHRIGASPVQVLQNLYIVHGKPAWSSQFLISCINACGRFSPLRYKMTGTEGKDDFGCFAWATDLDCGDILEAPKVTIAMAKKEGWYTKNGSKWQTMPELMLRYRAATFFARLYAPEITMGMRTQEEEMEISTDTNKKKSRFEAASTPIELVATEVRDNAELISDEIATKNIPVTIEEVKKFCNENKIEFVADTVIPQLNSIADGILLSKEN